MTDYRFRGKDPVIDVLRTIVETYASIENVTFKKALPKIAREMRDEITVTTLRNWFYGATRFPAYFRVARLYLFLKRYARRPVMIGDTKVYPKLRVVNRQ